MFAIIDIMYLIGHVCKWAWCQLPVSELSELQGILLAAESRELSAQNSSELSKNVGCVWKEECYAGAPDTTNLGWVNCEWTGCQLVLQTSRQAAWAGPWEVVQLLPALGHQWTVTSFSSPGGQSHVQGSLKGRRPLPLLVVKQFNGFRDNSSLI